MVKVHTFSVGRWGIVALEVAGTEYSVQYIQYPYPRHRCTTADQTIQDSGPRNLRLYVRGTSLQFQHPNRNRRGRWATYCIHVWMWWRHCPKKQASRNPPNILSFHPPSTHQTTHLRKQLLREMMHRACTEYGVLYYVCTVDM